MEAMWNGEDPSVNSDFNYLPDSGSERLHPTATRSLHHPEWSNENTSDTTPKVSFPPAFEGEVSYNAYAEVLNQQWPSNRAKQPATELELGVDPPSGSISQASVYSPSDVPDYASASAIWSLYVCCRDLIKRLHAKMTNNVRPSRSLAIAEQNLKDEVMRLKLWGADQNAKQLGKTLALAGEIKSTVAIFLLEITAILTRRELSAVYFCLWHLKFYRFVTTDWNGRVVCSHPRTNIPCPPSG
jgi:hypothetical protein